MLATSAATVHIKTTTTITTRKSQKKQKSFSLKIWKHSRGLVHAGKNPEFIQKGSVKTRNRVIVAFDCENRKISQQIDLTFND